METVGPSEVSGFPLTLIILCVSFADSSSFPQFLYILLLLALDLGHLFFSICIPLGISPGFMDVHIIYVLIYISNHIFFP